MASNMLTQGFYELTNLGFFEVIIPFALIFAIAYGILSKINIFGSDSKKFNVIIALCMGMIVVAQHVMMPGTAYDVVPMINMAMPQIALILVAIVCLYLVLGLFNKDFARDGSGIQKYMTYAALALVIFIFLSSSGIITTWDLTSWLGPEIWSLAVAVLVFVLIIYYVSGSDGGAKGKGDAHA